MSPSPRWPWSCARWVRVTSLVVSNPTRHLCQHARSSHTDPRFPSATAVVMGCCRCAVGLAERSPCLVRGCCLALCESLLRWRALQASGMRTINALKASCRAPAMHAADLQLAAGSDNHMVRAASVWVYDIIKCLDIRRMRGLKLAEHL